ncbi:MAG TPA: Lpg1974 family pore-forming outer membrane protein [Planctomycetaceae bacterium]
MRHDFRFAFAVAAPLLAASPVAEAQVAPSPSPPSTFGPVVPAGHEEASGPAVIQAGHYAAPDCTTCGPGCGPTCAGAFSGSRWSLYGGADYLHIRPHFSEAIGFAEVTQTPDAFRSVGRDLDFDYDSSFRVFAGATTGDQGDGFRFTYTDLSGDTRVDGTAVAPGTFLVDPYGNVVGGAGVIDPNSRLFGQIIPGGDAIRTEASVDVDVFDLEYVRPLAFSSSDWSAEWSAGLRVADVDQFYASTVTAGGLPLAYGDFLVDYLGVGPKLGVRGDRSVFGSGLSLFAAGGGSLLVGEYEVTSSNTVLAPATFRASQEEYVTRTVPVLETELGAAYRLGDNIRLSAGWMFQAWFDLGTSGGKFGGFFSGADDANVMSFDGLMLRAEIGF